MDENNNCFALVTGASRGLGKAIAFELAKKKKNLILVSLPGEGLKSYCTSLESYGIKVVSYEADLCNKEAIFALINWIRGSFKVNILINNIGLGGTHEFEKSSIDLIHQSIHLNITVMAMITHQLLPLLKQHKSSYILNVSSIASFCPIGYKAIYSASKVFIYYFTKSLAQELKNSKVHMSTVFPGPMKTNTDSIKRLEKHGFIGKMGLEPTEKVAQIAINKLFKRKPIIIIGKTNYALRILLSILPDWIRLPLVTNSVRKELEIE
ncbi:MAG: SDR family NAD(P)-dependent oxidoreductase [Bacteroidetes bacterium]|nr:SDR family NAD(P)-dependent oxidoreductase [Bacteroidota bacterium]